MSDLTKPADQFDLIGDSWPVESESAYHVAKVIADDSSTAASTQSESATDAGSKMGDEHGKTADAVSGGYGTAATQLSEQARSFTTISAWMADAAGKVRSAKTDIASLVRAGTQEIRDALNSEVSGTAVPPSSSELIAKYRTDITSIAKTLTTDLDGIGHSLHGDRGASRTPSYTSISTAPTPERADPHASMASYTGTPGAPAPEPHQLPEMPRASAPTPESPSTPSTPTAPVAPHAVNPTLSNLVSGSSPSSGTPNSPSASSTPTPSGIPAGQAHQSNEQHQAAKSPVLPRVPSIGLPNIPIAAADIATAVSSVSGQQLPTPPTLPGSSIPASTGITPGTSGTPPVTPAPPVGLSPVGGLSTPAVVQAPPASQGTPPTPTPGVQSSAPAQSPAPAPRGPVADLAWIQKSYGLAPGLELPKSENHIAPMLFITDLPEDEMHLHRALATIRHQFERSGWGQPMAVGLIKRGLETRTVYVTADAISIWPHGVRLPHGVIPLDEMTGAPSSHDLAGSLMVSEKLRSLIPRNWEVESLLSTVSGEEASQSVEQFQALVDAEELLVGKVSRGRDDVGADEAMRVFARAAIGSAGCGELDVESARIRAARWVGTQPTGYIDCLARYYLSDAAESMSAGCWGEAVYSSERYMSIRQSKAQVA